MEVGGIATHGADAEGIGWPDGCGDGRSNSCPVIRELSVDLIKKGVYLLMFHLAGLSLYRRICDYPGHLFCWSFRNHDTRFQPILTIKHRTHDRR